MRIICPNCESAFRLADGALGATGRKVRCTNCGTTWHARPGDDYEPPEPPAAPAEFSEPSDDEWKAALAEDDRKPADKAERLPDDDAAPDARDAVDDDAAAGDGPAPASNVVPFRPRDGSLDDALGGDPVDPAGGGAATIDAEPAGFEPKRRAAKSPKKAGKPGKPAKPAKSSQHAPLSPAVVLLAASAVVILIGGTSILARRELVRLFPDFAQLYALVGLPVNLRGLDLIDVKTYREVDGATPVLVVEGAIENIETASRTVPTLRFALKSAAGREVYAWTMDPPRSSLEAGAAVRFKSRLPAPPDAATDVDVRFTDRRSP